LAAKKKSSSKYDDMKEVLRQLGIGEIFVSVLNKKLSYNKLIVSSLINLIIR
jgi:hypothetical protein